MLHRSLLFQPIDKLVQYHENIRTQKKEDETTDPDFYNHNILLSEMRLLTNNTSLRKYLISQV